MSKRLRMMIYKEDSINYRYLVHGANHRSVDAFVPQPQ
jgi:hypothetical protein